MSQIIYSVPVTEKRKGETAVYRNPLSKFELMKPPQGVSNMQDILRISVAKFKSRKLLEDFTYNEVDQLSTAVGSWLLKNNHKIFYLHAKNRFEWTVCDLACIKYGIVSVPLYDTLGRQSIQHIFKLTQGKCILSSTQTLTTLINTKVIFQQKNIQTILLLEQISPEHAKFLAQNNIQTINFNDILKNKDLLPLPTIPGEQHLTYCFTSGTTGLPKGAILTHKNITCQLYSTTDLSNFQQDDVHLSFLPLAHIYERVVIYGIIFHGAQVRYYSGSIPQIVKDFMRVKPTFIALVPRLLNLFYNALRQFKHVDKALAQKAWKVKKQNWLKGIKTSPYDDTVFKPTIQMFGGRVKKLGTGSAPISQEILQFFRVILGCDFREGYGQTQTSATTFLTLKNEKKGSHVGGPNQSVQYKLVDIPEMNYSSDNNPPTGEICLKGDPIFIGYYKDQKNTKQTIDQQGWHHTGDVGLILPNGALKIIDRKKNIFKLSQGQYIAPEKIQNIYLRVPAIAEAFIYGDSLQSYTIAFLVPNKQHVEKFAKSKGIQKSFEQLCNNNDVIEFIHGLVTEQGRKDGLFGFELAKKIKLLPVSLMNYGILTNTMKLQRHIAKQVFKKQIEQLYK